MQRKEQMITDQASPLPSIVPMPLEVKVTLVMLCRDQHSSTWENVHKTDSKVTASANGGIHK